MTARPLRERLRPQSLFARLMLAQALMGVIVLILFMMWLATARAQAVAFPYARLWAEGFAAAAARPLSDDTVPMLASPGFALQRRAELPSGWLSPDISGLPGMRYWVSEFAANGVHIEGFRIEWRDGDLKYWFHVLQPGTQGLWLGVRTIPVWPFMNRHNIAITLLTLAVVAWLSWRFARRVTRPLEALRRRMDGDVLHLLPCAPNGRAGPPTLLGTAASAEIKAIDAAYHHLVERLRQSERERALLLAGVSHDLRGPLARIRLAAEMLPPVAATQDDVATITRNVDHADQLIGNFLDYVRAGALAMDESVDVAAAVVAVVARLGQPHERLQVQTPLPLRTQAADQERPQPAGPVLPHASTLLVDRLIFNLVDNALKHGLPPVKVRTEAHPDSVLIEVIDAGSGLPAGQEATLLQAFARADTSRHLPGSGLGLSVVQQVVNRLGGTLRFERDSQGHHARVKIPLRAASAGPDV